MTPPNIPVMPWERHGEIMVTQDAIKACLAFAGPGGPNSEGSVMLIGLALHNFITSFENCAFFKAHDRHSIPALARNGADQMDYSSILHLHAKRTPKGWSVGTPAQYPLPDGYEQQRVIEEAQMILKMADEPYDTHPPAQ